MNEWATYQLQDFIPFTADVYFRLLERMGETFWPLHLLTVALGAASVVLALKGRLRLACLLHAPLWAFIGVAFFIQRYAELNWAGGYIGYALIAQGLLLVLIALTGSGLDRASHPTSPPAVIGIAIVLFGLTVLPLLGPLTGKSWYQAEVFGIHPDPTAMTTLGLILIMLRGLALWIAIILPALLLLISAITLQVLGASGSIALFAVLVTALLGLGLTRTTSHSATTKES
ncbi:MFS transporter permease [Pseudomonas sp. gcc21]|uniref:DUF6064 family protein n=1 Tax=Pseudomonas sp. gcc21 TaxID=2726989 RepID=UPI00145196ED|nr:DUF6064 family protein [Pseudomonas sp. gcc21]QJD57859.1 MFS transporter permease [Pseudomonas sp. gcc21]